MGDISYLTCVHESHMVYKAAETPWEAAEQPVDDDKETSKHSAEDKHDCDELIVPEELPDSYSTTESHGEQVCEEKNEQEVVLKEISDPNEAPELMEESIWDCTGSEVPDEHTAEIDYTPMPGEEPSLQLKSETDEQNIPSQDNLNLLVGNNKVNCALPNDFIAPTGTKFNSDSQSSMNRYGPYAKKPKLHGTNNLCHVWPVHRITERSYWLLILLSLCSMVNNATGLQEQRSEILLRANHHVYFIGTYGHLNDTGSISFGRLLFQAARTIRDFDTMDNNQNIPTTICIQLLYAIHYRDAAQADTGMSENEVSDSHDDDIGETTGYLLGINCTTKRFGYLSSVTSRMMNQKKFLRHSDYHGFLSSKTRRLMNQKDEEMLIAFLYTFTPFILGVFIITLMDTVQTCFNRKTILQIISCEVYEAYNCSDYYEDCQSIIKCKNRFLYEFYVSLIWIATSVLVVCVLHCCSGFLQSLLMTILFVVAIIQKTSSKQRLKLLCSDLVICTRISLWLKIILCVSTLMFIPSCAAHDPGEDLDVVIENGSKSYECFHEGTLTFQWKFNNNIINSFNAGVDTYNHPPYGFLILNPIPLSLNNTRVQCFAKLAGNRSIFVLQEILYVQGVPAPVHNVTYFLKGGILNIFWEPSFTLMLMNDFKFFCTKFYNHITHDIKEIQCGIEASNYSVSSDLKNLSCGAYSVMVIAQNIVGNSTPSSLRIWNKELRVSDIVVTALNHTGFKKKVQFFMVMDICFSHTKLWFDNSSLQTSDRSQSDIFQCLLDEDMMFEVFLEFNNFKLNSTSSTMIISTYDLIKTVVSLIYKGRYLIKSSFIANSNTREVLYAIMFIDDSDNENFVRSLYLRTSFEIAMQGVEKSIPNGKYHIISYDINWDLLPTSNSPANINTFVVSNSIYEEMASNKGNCTLQQSKITVNFSCNCSERHLYHIILQKNNTNVIETYILNCSLTRNLSIGQYQIIVFRENGANLVATSSPYYTKVFTVTDSNTDLVIISKSNSKLIGAVLGGAFVGSLIVIVATIAILTVIMFTKKRMRLQNKDPIYQISMKYIQNQEPTISWNEMGNKRYYQDESGNHGNDIKEKNVEDEDLDKKLMKPICESSVDTRHKYHLDKDESTHDMPRYATFRSITENKYPADFSSKLVEKSYLITCNDKQEFLNSCDTY